MTEVESPLTDPDERWRVVEPMQREVDDDQIMEGAIQMEIQID